MSRVVEFLPEAERETEVAYRWYERQRIVAVRTRKVLLRRFPYLVLYALEERRILVTAVYHVRLDPLIWSDHVREHTAESVVPHAEGAFA